MKAFLLLMLGAVGMGLFGISITTDYNSWIDLLLVLPILFWMNIVGTAALKKGSKG